MKTYHQLRTSTQKQDKILKQKAFKSTIILGEFAQWGPASPVASPAPAQPICFTHTGLLYILQYSRPPGLCKSPFTMSLFLFWFGNSHSSLRHLHCKNPGAMHQN